MELSVETSEKILVEENVDIATGFPISSSTSSTSDEWDEYIFDEYYPKQNVKVEEFSGIWSIWISPYEYDPTTRSLYLTKDFDITIRISPKYTGPSTTSIESADAVHNAETVDPQLVGIPSLVNPDLDPHPDMCYGVDYMIITSKELAKTYDPLVKWKRQKGLSAKVMMIDSIDLVYPGKTRQERIKNCIKDYYLGRLNYVLLGGDIDIVPSPLCHGR